MKKITLLTIVIIFAGLLQTYAQKKNKPFSGMLNVAIEYEGDWDAATLAQQPKEFTIVMNEHKQKSDVMAGGAMISTVVNTLDSSVTTLINAMGMKFFVKQTKDLVIEAMEEHTAPTINYLDETKMIAGYECKKAEYITLDEFDDEVTTIVYYTTSIGKPSMNWGGQFHGLSGFPMEYSVQTDEGNIIFKVIEVKSKKIKDVEFMIPSDYEEMSPEQLRSLGG